VIDDAILARDDFPMRDGLNLVYGLAYGAHRFLVVVSNCTVHRVGPHLHPSQATVIDHGSGRVPRRACAVACVFVEHAANVVDEEFPAPARFGEEVPNADLILIPASEDADHHVGLGRSAETVAADRIA